MSKGGTTAVSIGLWLLGCTRDNPAYEDGTQAGEEAGEDASEETTSAPRPPGSSSTDPATEGETSRGSGLDTTGAEPGTTDAGGSETGDTGEPTEPPPVGPYGELVRLEISSPFPEDDPTLPDDMAEIYFSSPRPEGLGNDDIWRAVRDETTGSWGMPELVMELSTPSRDNTPEISPDGLTMYLSSDRDGLPEAFDVYVSTRRTRESQWSTPTRDPDLSTPAREVCPFRTADEQHVYSCQGMLGIQELVRFDRTEKGWTAPVPVMELETPAAECAAWLDSTNRLILFTSTRPGGTGDADLYMATRPSDDVQFGAPTELAELNGMLYDDDPWLAPDGSVLFFSSVREPENATDLYMVERVER